MDITSIYEYILSRIAEDLLPYGFELSVPLARNVKYASQVKRTSCMKCAFGAICGTLNFTLRPRRNTSLGR